MIEVFYGIINATATLYNGSDKMYIVTAGHECVEEAAEEMHTKIRELRENNRRLWVELYPCDTAVVNIPEVDEAEIESFKIPEGYFGRIILWEPGQEYRRAD